MNECIIYVIILYSNMFFLFFFLNNVGSLTIHDPILWSHLPPTNLCKIPILTTLVLGVFKRFTCKQNGFSNKKSSVWVLFDYRKLFNFSFSFLMENRVTIKNKVNTMHLTDSIKIRFSSIQVRKIWRHLACWAKTVQLIWSLSACGKLLWWCWQWQRVEEEPQ